VYKPPHIYDLFKINMFNQAVANGYIKVQKHPELPLSIANYTDKAQYDKAWNDATLNSRGLIFDHAGKIIARPFKKFFNHGEDADLDITVLGKPNVYEKRDGSMGTLYPLPDGSWAVATRGSFASEQAVWATEWLRKWMPDFAPEPGTTQVVEIIYPKNRIVVDYEGYEGLVSLAVIDNATGLTLFDASPGWTGDVVEQHDIGESEWLIDRPNREGYVLHFPDHDVRVKVKHAEYVRLHRVVTGATELAVWRALVADDGFVDLLDGAPDDLVDWVDMVATYMRMDVAKWVAARVNEFELIKLVLGKDVDLKSREGRKAFATQATDHQKFPGAMFALLDGKDIRPMAYDQIRPHGTGERFSGAWN
jgi:RNA ligase